MKRVDTLCLAILVPLASFVAVEAFAMRHERIAPPEIGAVKAVTATVEADGGAADVPSDANVAVALTPLRRPVRISATPLAPVNPWRHLNGNTGGTYIDELLAAHDSSLARWPDRRVQPLRVWVQPTTQIEDWSAESVSIVRNAFLDWSDTGIPVAFTFVLDSAAADVRVTFIDRFNEPISGKTLWSHDERWWILEASIIIAVHHVGGETLDGSATRAIALHEVGHLIGLDHTSDSTSIMTPRVRVKNLSMADRATAQLLYLLPPGRVRDRR